MLENQNRITCSRVTAILLNWWTLPIGEAALGRVCACSPRSRLVSYGLTRQIYKNGRYYHVLPAITTNPVAPSPYQHEMPGVGGHKSHPSSCSRQVGLVVEAGHCVQVQVLNPGSGISVNN